MSQFEKKTDHEDQAHTILILGAVIMLVEFFWIAVVFIQDPGRSVRVSADPCSESG